jgi:hypothetical protein
VIPSRATAAASRLVALFAGVQPGTAVIVRPDEGPAVETKTIGRSWLFRGAPVIEVDGFHLPVRLERVSLAGPPTPARVPFPVALTARRPLIDPMGSVVIVAALAWCLWGGVLGIFAWVTAP